MLKALRLAAMGFAAAILVSCAPAETPKAATPEAAVTVFAASSLTDVMKKIGDLYAAEGHPAPVFNFAASSELARQIEQGAKADVFISADEDWMNALQDKGLIDVTTRRSVLSNELVLIAPADRPITIEFKPGMDLNAALKGGKLAIGNPDSVPAGKYAKQALEHLGAWAGVEASTARAENVRAALRFVEAGEAAAGIVYATDAQAAGDKVAVAGIFPADSHMPISYPEAITTGNGEGPGKAFLQFLASDKAVKAYRDAGFGVFSVSH